MLPYEHSEFGAMIFIIMLGRLLKRVSSYILKKNSKSKQPARTQDPCSNSVVQGSLFQKSTIIASIPLNTT